MVSFPPPSNSKDLTIKTPVPLLSLGGHKDYQLQDNQQGVECGPRFHEFRMKIFLLSPNDGYVMTSRGGLTPEIEEMVFDEREGSVVTGDTPSHVKALINYES